MAIESPSRRLANFRVVLVRTSHPGNIGSTARAMKNMGLASLVLVAPKRFPDPEATALASGADDVLAGARVTDQGIIQGDAAGLLRLRRALGAESRTVRNMIIRQGMVVAMIGVNGDVVPIVVSLLFAVEPDRSLSIPTSQIPVWKL